MYQLSARDCIERLELLPHPEGGYYREIYRSTGMIPLEVLPDALGFSGRRNFATGIYFLLEAGNFSAFHRISSDEGWHFYAGSTLEVHIIDPQTANHHCLRLGRNLPEGEEFQAYVKAGCWFGSRPAPDAGPDGWALVGCTVSPGFDFEDFEMAEREALIAAYPMHEEIIMALTRGV